MKEQKEFMMISIDEISEPKTEVRSYITKEGLDELASSIRQVGIIQPLVVAKNGKKYEIIAGHRRYLAAKICRLASVPCVVVSGDKKDLELRKIHENLFREDLDVVSEASFYKYLITKLKLTQKEVAKKMGKSESYISQRLAVLHFPEFLMQALKDRQVDFSVASELAKIDDEEEQARLLEYCINSGASYRTVVQWVIDYKKSKGIAIKETAREVSTGESDRPKKILIPCKVCEQEFDSNELSTIIVCQKCREVIEKELSGGK